MKQETLTAIRGSIKKWEQILNYKQEDKGADNCPLCSLYYYNEHCIGCPVVVVTGRSRCVGSPYDDWHRYFDGTNIPYSKVIDATSAELALEELTFLRTLLPKEEP